MSGFLKRLLGKSSASKKQVDAIADIMGEQDLNYVISAYDSTIRINDKDEYIRRYALRVKAEPEILEDFIKKTGADRRNIQHDGTLMLLPPIPGAVEFFPQSLRSLSSQLQEKGFTLPVQAIETAISQDIQTHPRPETKGTDRLR